MFHQKSNACYKGRAAKQRKPMKKRLQLENAQKTFESREVIARPTS